MTCTWLPVAEWNWSTVWEAAGAIGTVGALAFALHVALEERKERNRENARLAAALEADALERRRAQALSVVVASQTRRTRVGPRPEGDDTSEPLFHTHEAIAWNTSDLPVFRFALAVEIPYRAVEGCDGSIGDEDFACLWAATAVAPGEDKTVEFKRVDGGDLDGRVFAEFTDVNGVRWRRYETGELVEMTSVDQP